MRQPTRLILHIPGSFFFFSPSFPHSLPPSCHVHHLPHPLFLSLVSFCWYVFFFFFCFVFVFDCILLVSCLFCFLFNVFLSLSYISFSSFSFLCFIFLLFLLFFSSFLRPSNSSPPLLLPRPRPPLLFLVLTLLFSSFTSLSPS